MLGRHAWVDLDCTRQELAVAESGSQLRFKPVKPARRPIISRNLDEADGSSEFVKLLAV